MKHSVILLCTMLLLSDSVFAQTSNLSVKVGANLSTVKGDDVESSDMRMGYQIGIKYRIKVSEVILISPGIQFTQRGSQDQESESYEWDANTEISYDYSMKMRRNYLDLPVSFEYLIDPRLSFLFRPTFSYLLGNKYSVVQRECLGSDCTGIREEDEFDTRSTDLSLGLGLGYKITDDIGVSVGYQWGYHWIVME